MQMKWHRIYCPGQPESSWGVGSVLGNAITGSKVMKSSIAGLGRGPPLYPESFWVSLNSGAAITEKFLMCVLKKLNSSTKEGIVLSSLGALAVWMALS
jgi:hypothetical protein